MEVYLIRHTAPDQKAIEGLCYGQSDIPLASSFESEASRIKEKLPPSFDAVYTSPLTRCMRLADFLTTKKIQKDIRLLELNFGEWEMKRWDEIDNAALDKWMNDFVSGMPPRGESFIQLQQRVSHFFQELQQQNFKRVIVVAHAGVIRCVLAKQKNIALHDSFKIEVKYGAIQKIIL